MIVPSELRQLSRLFPETSPLYLVGGAVRDNLLGIQSTDFDVAAALTTQEVKQLLVGSKFKISGEYPRTGTLIILGGRIKCEYTTFRTDSYPSGRGDHTPQTVTFTDDLYLDALRRDFTCNAIYYNISKDSFVDPTNGIAAIKSRIIETTREPEKVLQEDALRIMRIARQSCELGFHAEPEVLAAASDYVNGLKHIARERIGQEIIKILNCRKKHANYKDGFKPSYGLAILEEIGANELIFGKKLTFTTLCQLDNLYEQGFYAYNSSMQFALIMLDCTASEVEDICGRLALSKAETAEIVAIIDGYNYINNLNFNALSYENAKLAAAKVYKFTKPIIALRMARGKDVERLCDITHIIQNLNLPTKVSDLKINGNNVIAAGFSGTIIGDVLNYVLKQSIINEFTTHDEQFKLIENYGGNNEHK